MLRPFEGLADETDWIALREVVPAATAPLRVVTAPNRDVVLSTVLPLAWPAMVRTDGKVFLGLQVASAAYAFALDGERLTPLWVLPLQLFVYRQLMYLVVIESVASAAYGIRLRWHKLDRTGQLGDAPVTSERVSV